VTARIDATSQRSRRTALAILAGAVVLAGVVIFLIGYLPNRHYARVLDDMTSRLERYRRIAAMQPEVAKSLESMRQQDPKRMFLRTGAAALSAAEAQEALRSIIEASGGRLITMQAPTTREDGRYRQVSVNVQLTSNIQSLRKILHAVETRTPFLFVDNLMVRSQVPSNFKPGVNAEPEMFVQFDVSGYTLTGSAS
jgi:general secretion pathway protein M